MPRSIELFLILSLVLAGCSSTGSPTPATETSTIDQPETDTMTPIQTPTETPTPTPTPTTTPTPTPTPTPLPPQNPWRKETVTVGVNDSATADRSYSTWVFEAIKYWNSDGKSYATYPVELRFDPDAENPDIEIRFIPEIPECGLIDGGTTIGCAPTLNTDSTPADPEIVEVRSDMVAESTRKTVIHELGHVLGIEHNQPPYTYMNEITDPTYYNKTDATDRVHPWHTDEITVAYNLSEIPAYERANTLEQLGRALDYYNEGADGFTPENVTFRLIENETTADIWIKVDDDPYQGDHASIGEVYGINIDDDEYLEYYTSYDIYIDGILTERRGWHAGFWIANALGEDDETQFPPPFRNTDSADDRENWWY